MSLGYHKCVLCEKIKKEGTYYTKEKSMALICSTCKEKQKELSYLLHSELARRGFRQLDATSEKYYRYLRERRKESDEQRKVQLERLKVSNEEKEQEKIQEVEEKRVEKRKRVLEPLNKFVGMNHIKEQLEQWFVQLDTVETLKGKTKIKFEKPLMNLFIIFSEGDPFQIFDLVGEEFAIFKLLLIGITCINN